MRLIVSMATMSCRKERLLENLPSILEQSQDFDKLIINIDDNISVEDIVFYTELSKKDNRIFINSADSKWRSCNKLLPTLLMFPNDNIITVDDDVYYPKECFKKLVELSEKNPGCIVSHETQPIIISDDNQINYLNQIDIKIKQRCWSKYLSNCALFPPHVFDGTDLFDYDKMMKVTKGMHDELWFWVNSTLNKVKVVSSNYIRTFSYDILTPWKKDEFRLCDFNTVSDNHKEHMKQVNEEYGERLIEIIKNNPAEFILDESNIAQFLHEKKYISILYGKNMKIIINGLTKGWVEVLKHSVKGDSFIY